MSENGQQSIWDNSPHFAKEQVFFNNFNLNARIFTEQLTPIIATLCKRIESTYKSRSAITFTGSSAFAHGNIITCMQGDDVCLKLLHVETCQPIYLTLGARFARTLLIRLLSTSLIDDSNPLPFSSTEKGILAFIVARLLFDLKGSLHENMPDLKLVGIYHGQDEALNDASIMGFGIYKFSFTFGPDVYPIVFFAPKDLFYSFKRPKPSHATMLARTGHIKRPLSLVLKKLICERAMLSGLASGDMILFDSFNQQLVGKAILGSVQGYWEDHKFQGQLIAKDDKYYFSLSSHILHKEDGPVENVEVSFAKDLVANGDNIETIANSIRVTLAIEIARLPMSLSEIAQLRENEIIELHRKVGDDLEIRMEDKIIGYCQPVVIDGRLGIRIAKLLGEHEPSV